MITHKVSTAGASTEVRGVGARYSPSFQILNARHSPLSVRDHLREQIREAGSTELGIPTPIQIPVVDGFAVRRYPQAGTGLCRRY